MKQLYAVEDADGAVRYIGQARDARLRMARGSGSWHWHRSRNGASGPFCDWLRTLDEMPRVRVLAVLEDHVAGETECAAIASCRKRHPGVLLSNRSGRTEDE